eukprot:5890230-Lingulodinium_polyedra.AAC.1
MFTQARTAARCGAATRPRHAAAVPAGRAGNGKTSSSALPGRDASSRPVTERRRLRPNGPPASVSVSANSSTADAREAP